MAEYIEREAAREIVVELQKNLCPVGRYGRGYVYGIERDMYDELEKILDDVDAIPAADVVEVVRCACCRYGSKMEDGDVYCHLVKDSRTPDDFCSYGKRKEWVRGG